MNRPGNETIQAVARDPASAYARRLEERQVQRTRLARKYGRLSRGRIALLALVVAVAWLAEKERLLPLLLLPPALILEGIIRWRNRVRKVWWRVANAVRFNRRLRDRLEGRWAGQGEPGTRFLDESHPCSLDLDLFGRGSLFERLCVDATGLGQSTLAAWLCSPAPAPEVRDRQSAVGELLLRLDLWEDLALLGAEAPPRIDLDELAAWGQSDVPARVDWNRRMMVALGLVSLICVGFCAGGAGPVAFLTAFLSGGLAAWLHDRSRSNPSGIEGKTAELAFFSAVLARLERERFASPRLSRLRAELDGSGGSAARQVGRLRWLTALHLGWAVAAWRKRFGPRLGRWLAAVRECEAFAALAAYAFENPADPFPEVIDGGPCFDAEGLGHPLLPRDRCVCNDVRLDGARSALVISGSNMSGKSTLLRTVGVNAVLALTGAPVRAKHLGLSPLTLGATLRIQDSLQAGRSRFYAEVTRVRQLLDLARGPWPLLFLLDELFSGTNSHDRRLGAEAVVRTLLEAGAIGLVTTHDLALTQLAEQLAPRVTNVHFADHFADGQMTFDYRMRPGVCPSSNGLALMRAVGIVV
jgi:hypothetical protein